MPHFATFKINREGKREKVGNTTAYGHAVAMAQDAFQEGARGAWVETDGADDPVIKFRLGEVPK
ncbi:MAG: hypothetical protein AB7V39_00610 [Nitrospiraceae bacterium]